MAKKKTTKKKADVPPPEERADIKDAMTALPKDKLRQAARELAEIDRRTCKLQTDLRTHQEKTLKLRKDLARIIAEQAPKLIDLDPLAAMPHRRFSLDGESFTVYETGAVVWECPGRVLDGL